MNLVRRSRHNLAPLARTGVALAATFTLIVALAPAVAAQTAAPARCNGLPVTAEVTLGLPFVGTDNRDIIIGTAGDDDISGLGGGDIICGLGGNDRISGGLGNDLILGGTGNDQLFGNAGRDQLRGGPGIDRIFAGKGNDLVQGGFGNDRLFGGKGNDRLQGGGGFGDFCSGGTGFDRHRDCEQIQALDFLRPSGFGPLVFGIDTLAQAQLKLATTFGPATSVSDNAECPGGPTTIAAWGLDFSLAFVDDIFIGWFYRSAEVGQIPLAMANGITTGVTQAQVDRLAPGTDFFTSTLGPEFANDAGASSFGGLLNDGAVDVLFAGSNCFFR